MRLKAALKDWRRRRLLRRAGIGIEVRGPRFVAGARSGVWTVDPRLLDEHSVVYSVGVGDNIAWDESLIEKFGCTVHAFDPTPRSVEWLRRQELPPGFVHHALAVAAHDGPLAFALPRKPRDVNFRPRTGSAVAAADTALVDNGGQLFTAPAERLLTIARRLGHERIDVLKLDIEGGEYAVLDDLLRSGPAVRQLLVEFHHGEAGIPFERTARAIDALRAAGHRIFDISPRGLEFTFVGQDWSASALPR
jgi:FkbM family methyltransferase